MRTKTMQFGKRLLAAFMTAIFLMAAFMFVGGSTASAAEIDQAKINAAAMAAHQANVASVLGDVEEGFELVDKFTTEESDGILATTLIYVKQGDAPCSSEWQEKKVTAKKLFTLSYANYKWVTLTVWGTFSWNGETAKVSGADGTAEAIDKGIEITKEFDAVSKSDCGDNSWFGNKYAYVEKRCSATNGHNDNDFKLWLDVNRNGDINTNPGDAEVTEG